MSRRRGRNVDAVVTHAAAGDHPQLRQLGQHRSRIAFPSARNHGVHQTTLHVLAGFGREDPELARIPMRGFLLLCTVLTLALSVPLFAFRDLIHNKIPEQFPRLRFGFIEASASWVPFLIHKLRRDNTKRWKPHWRSDAPCKAP